MGRSVKKGPYVRPELLKKVVDPDYNGILSESIGKFLYSFPIIMILSLVLAMILL